MTAHDAAKVVDDGVEIVQAAGRGRGGGGGGLRWAIFEQIESSQREIYEFGDFVSPDEVAEGKSLEMQQKNLEGM